jgi:predicted phage terminase large subunit-like protein
MTNLINSIDTDVVKAELARRKLINFAQYIKNDYIVNWHHKLYAATLDRFVEGGIKKLMVFCPPQTGKAIEDNTPVLTTKGWVNHGSLNVGDYVFGKDGTPKKIIATEKSYMHECQSVQLDNGECFVAAKEHEWEVDYQNDNRTYIKGSYSEFGKSKFKKEYVRISKIVETQNILSGYNRRSPAIKLVDSLEIAQKELPIDPYLLGCWIGDGISKNGYLCCGNQDYEHFYKLGIGRVERKDYHIIRVEELHVKLRLNNLLNNKHIPIEYLLSSKEQRMELLRGLMDTDGFVGKNGECEFVTIKKELANSFYTLLFSLGIKTSFKESDAKLYGKIVSKKYRFLFRPDSDIQIFKLARKQDRLTNKTQGDRDDKKKLFIRSVTDCGLKSVKCIQVEGGFYLIGKSLTVTHNSEMCSRLMPAQILGKRPNTKIAISSYNHDFTVKFNRDVQRIIDSEEYKKLFPKTQLNSKNVVTDSHNNYVRNALEFEIVGFKGGLRAVSVGGALTGTKVDVAIIDDPYKDAQDAFSQAYENKIRDWWDMVLSTRLHNESQICLTLTRWKDDDLVKYILDKSKPNEWEIVVFEGIKETENPNDPRQIGEALWEERHSLERYLDVKKNTPSVFQAMYQQNPVKKGGNVVKQGHFIPYELQDLPKGTVHAYIDTALSGKEQKNNDPTGIILFQVFQNNIYLKRFEKGLFKFNEVLEKIKELGGFYFNSQSKIYIENKANAKSIEQEIKRTTNFNVILHNIKGDKMARLQIALPKLESGRVLVPYSETWVQPFIEQCGIFPNATHDEEIDVLTGAISTVFDIEKTLSMPTYRPVPQNTNQGYF